MLEPKFEIVLLDEVYQFLEKLNSKISRKILYNLERSRFIIDPKLFKKLNHDIWEFRTNYAGIQYRIFAFGDSNKASKTLVIATHAIIKKSHQIPTKEMNKAINIKHQYFNK